MLPDAPAPVTSVVDVDLAKTTVVDADLAKTTVVDALSGPIVGDTSMTYMRQSMIQLETDNEITKRFLLGLRYMTSNTPAREITFHATSGDITFGKYL